LAPAEALKHLESLKGTQLDPELVDRFARIVAANPELAACPS
jgi:HD-GYP domain-containing protein (c-di-GMP phosphodiesterase class II)